MLAMFKFISKNFFNLIYVKAAFFMLLFLFSVNTNAQNVGIGTTTPSTTLHVVKPSGVLDPLRVEGLRLTNTVSNILMVDTSTGIVKRISFDSLVSLVRDSVNTDDQLLSLSNDTLYIEDGNWVVIQHPTDTNLIDSLILLKTDTLFNLLKDSLYIFISDSLLKDSLWIYKLDSILLKDTIFINDTTYTIIRDSLLGDTIFIDSLFTIIRDSLLKDSLFLDSLRALLKDSVNDADSVVGNEYNTNFTLSGTTLTITDGGGPLSVNLSPVLSGTKPITIIDFTGPMTSYNITTTDGDIAYFADNQINDTLYLPSAALNQYYEFTITRYGNGGSGNNGCFLYATGGDNIVNACSTTNTRIRLYGTNTTGTCLYHAVRIKSDGTQWIIMNQPDN